MARKPILDTVEHCINICGALTLADKRELINEIHAHLFGKRTDHDLPWEAMIARLKQDRTNVQSNSKRWAPDLAPVYAEYVRLLDAALVRINGARLRCHTLQAATSEALVRNRSRQARGELPTGVCNGSWQSWIPPHLIVELLKAQDLAYTMRGAEPSRGKRAYLFVSATLKAKVDKQIKQAYSVLENVRRITRSDMNTSPAKAYGTTPFRALMLCAVRQAELNLGEIERELKRGTRPYWQAAIPVNWRALLEPEMRARLRDADANPQAVDTSGLTSFYKPPEYGESVQDVVEIEADDGDDSTVSPEDDDRIA